MRSAHVIPISLLALILSVHGCLINELEEPAESKACQALLAEADEACFCDPITYELICAGPLDMGGASAGMMSGGTVTGGAVTGGTVTGGTVTAGVMVGGSVTGGMVPGGATSAGVEVELCDELIPPGCSCDPLSGVTSCGADEFSCNDWLPNPFSYPLDDSACPAGTPFTRYDITQGLYVGVIRCGGGSMSRVYLSFDGFDYYPATDLSGRGEDHCELIEPGWTPLSDDSSITSGGCSGCSISSTITITGGAFARSMGGELFEYTPTASYPASRLVCGTSCL